MHYVTFVTNARHAYLFLITKNMQVIFSASVKVFHTKSEINKLLPEGSASASHSQFLSTQGQERCQ